ncbi:MAG: alpha-E domain-containing protein [Polyangiaceae bacterium]|nr:alpha-E domain-containing protein [Polyangiaceae bacterium]
MLSRVAESIFWLNRCIERADNVARIVDVSSHLALDGVGGASTWAALVATTGDDAWFAERYGEPTRERVLRFLAIDRAYANSIVSCLAMARENARTIRDHLSSEAWEHVNRTCREVHEAPEERVLDAPHVFFGAVRRAAATFVGVAYVTQTHDEGWHFGRLGRLMERADKTSRILDVASYLLPKGLEDPEMLDEAPWAALLRSASALEMYRQRHGLIAPRLVVEQLVCERRFPRSMRYCLTKANRSLHAITASPLGSAGTKAERALGELASELEFVTSREVVSRGLHEYIDGFQTSLNAAGDAVFETFFALDPGAPPPPSTPRGHDQ